MITDNETNKVYFSELLKTNSVYEEAYTGIIRILDKHKIDYDFLKGTKDIWARDYMPVQVSKDKFIEYRYDPDYLMGKKYRKIKTYPDIVCDEIGLKTKKTDIVIDGGNLVKSSDCIIMTDKVLSENKDLYKPTVLLDELKYLFEVDKIVTIPWDSINEYFGHADGMIRFIDNSTVLLNGYFETYDEKFKQKLFGSLEQNKLIYKTLKFDVKKENDLNWCYINYLHMKDIILLPKLGIDEDIQALEQIKGFFPEYAIKDKIIQIDVNQFVKNGGALNCISWNIKI